MTISAGEKDMHPVTVTGSFSSATVARTQKILLRSEYSSLNTPSYHHAPYTDDYIHVTRCTYVARAGACAFDLTQSPSHICNPAYRQYTTPDLLGLLKNFPM